MNTIKKLSALFTRLFKDNEIPIKSAALDRLKNVAQDYAIDICYYAKDLDEQTKFRQANKRNLTAACEVLIEEIGLYPRDIIARSLMRQIVLCEGLHFKEKLIGGLSEADKGIIYISIEAGKLPTRRTFHHELFHCIDFFNNNYRYSDPNWEALNDKTFKYYRRKDNNEKTADLVNRPGFITNYAMTQVREDKAELYANLIVHYNSVIERTKADVILQKKCEAIKALLKQFSPQFNENFWLHCSRNSEYLADQIEDPIVVTLEIWGELMHSRPMWFIYRIGAMDRRPIAFYSEEEAIACLTKLGVIDFQELRGLHIGPKYKVEARVPSEVLREFFQF